MNTTANSLAAVAAQQAAIRAAKANHKAAIEAAYADYERHQNEDVLDSAIETADATELTALREAAEAYEVAPKS
jgi:hypothetical protein